MTDTTAATILSALERIPLWVRHDLASKDTGIRTRAEETLAAMLTHALANAGRPDERWVDPGRPA